MFGAASQNDIAAVSGAVWVYHKDTYHGVLGPAAAYRDLIIPRPSDVSAPSKAPPACEARVPPQLHALRDHIPPTGPSLDTLDGALRRHPTACTAHTGSRVVPV